MKIALIGYGKMGREVEKAAIAHSHTVTLTIDNEEDWIQKGPRLSECDVAIEFTVPSIAVENIRRCLIAGIPVVAGTTGWHTRLQEVQDLCSQYNGSVFYASNFSIGVNILFHLNRKLASIMQQQPQYVPGITEIHHAMKLDAPSGTAITLANDLISHRGGLKNWTLEKAANDELQVISVREGSVPGTHIVEWTSGADTISLRHEAFSRAGFAAGAVAAAAWLVGRKGLFTMSDMLSFD